MASRSSHVRVALGLHPQLVAERADDFSEFERFLPDARYVGEVGLDAGPRHYKSLEAQKQIFDRVLKLCAMQGNKILTIHSVRAIPTVLDMLEESLLPSHGKAVLHWFTGTPKQAARAAELGCYFSINAEMLEKPQHRTLIAGLPEDRLLTETDGPFVNVDDRPTIPSDVIKTVTRVAEVRGYAPSAMAALILRNLQKLVADH
jgi:TatD DNase family protein